MAWEDQHEWRHRLEDARPEPFNWVKVLVCALAGLCVVLARVIWLIVK